MNNIISLQYIRKKEDQALDLIQECTYRAWKNIKNLKQESLFKPWISKILVNIAITRIKKESTSCLEVGLIFSTEIITLRL